MSLTSNPKSVIRLLTCTLICTTAANVAFLAILVHLFNKLVSPPHTYSYIGDDFPSQLPIDLPSVGLALTDGPSPYFSLLADDEWGAQFPAGAMGFTDLGPRNRTFIPSMFHQLHCLDVIRVGMVTNGTGFMHHVEHCVRYLRQIVLCAADVTLEPAYRRFDGGKWTWGADGIGSVHRCKDWTALRGYLEAHQAKSAEPTGEEDPDETES